MNRITDMIPGQKSAAPEMQQCTQMVLESKQLAVLLKDFHSSCKYYEKAAERLFLKGQILRAGGKQNLADTSGGVGGLSAVEGARGSLATDLQSRVYGQIEKWLGDLTQVLKQYDDLRKAHSFMGERDRKLKTAQNKLESMQQKAQKKGVEDPKAGIMEQKLREKGQKLEAATHAFHSSVPEMEEILRKYLERGSNLQNAVFEVASVSAYVLQTLGSSNAGIEQTYVSALSGQGSAPPAGYPPEKVTTPDTYDSTPTSGTWSQGQGQKWSDQQEYAPPTPQPGWK